MFKYATEAMPTFKQKNVIKTYKLRLQDKLKTVTEETENAISFLNNCVAEFKNRVQYILEIKDEKCLSLYRKLIRDLENYSEKIFILQASLEEVTEEDSDSTEDESVANASRDQQQLPSSSLSSDLTCTEVNINQQKCTEQNMNNQKPSKENLSSQGHAVESLNFAKLNEECVDVKKYIEQNLNLQCYPEENNVFRYLEENLNFNSSDRNDDDGGSITEDDFYSLHSDNNIQNTNNNASVDFPLYSCDNKTISAGDYVSNISASQNSCYYSIASNICESLVHKDIKLAQSFEMKKESLLESSEVILEIQDVEFEISSSFSATFCDIIDPSDFWIQIENSYSSKLRFSKSEYGHLKCLSSIKKGTCCLAPFKSTSFYFRAKSFLDAKSEKELVKVLFIDHGSYQNIPVCELRPLPKSAYEIPAQAINCYLYGIAPTDDTWSAKSIERFKEFENFCIETVVKSKAGAYGVQLIAKLYDNNFSDDFSVDIAQALCLDGFAISLNEFDSCITNQNHPCSSELSKPVYSKTDSSLEVSGSYDINAISNDSGVSVTSAYKSSQGKKSEIFDRVSEDVDNVSSVHMKDVFPYNKNLNEHNHDIQMENLISFESSDALADIQSSNDEIRKLKNDLSLQYCFFCDNKKFCLHLEVPFPTLLFVEKDMVVVMISHIVNPYEFYVNMAMENIVTLDDLREQMTYIYESEKNVPCIKINDISENMYCAGRFDADNYWYRVKIITISPEHRENDEVFVQYIDYGNTAKIKCSNLKPLTQEFSKHPCFAIKCSLAGVKPIKTMSSEEKPYWPEGAVEAFKKLISFERCLTAQICNELCKDGTYSVLLWDTDDSNDLLINASLANDNVAVFDANFLCSPSSIEKVVKPSIESWDPMLEEYIDSHNSYAVDDEDIEVATTGYQSKDEQYTCNYFALRGHCPRGSNCPYEHLPLVESGITRDQEEVYCMDNVLIVPETVSNMLVQVSAILTPSHFYVILPFSYKIVDEIDDLVSKGASYNEITNSEGKALLYALDKHYSNSPFQENTTVALSCGTIVVAKRKWDEKWHRGRVVDVISINKPAKIFFVDSGDHEWVSRKFIRTILPQFLHTPFQAIQCCLHGIEPTGFREKSSWSSDSVNFFKDYVAGEVFLAEIIHRFDNVYYVTLRKTSRNNHKTVAEHLVSSGYAECHKVIQQQPNVKKREIIYVPG